VISGQWLETESSTSGLIGTKEQYLLKLICKWDKTKVVKLIFTSMIVRADNPFIGDVVIAFRNLIDANRK